MIIQIEGKPIAQPRHRIANGRAYIPKDHLIHGWKDQIYWACFNTVRDLDKYPLQGAVIVSLEFTFKRPKSVSKTQIYKITKPDIDNLEKAVLDAMNGVIYKDDAQVCDGDRKKIYGNKPGVKITISEADNG